MKLEQVAPHWNAILFQLVYRSNILQISLFISIYQTAVGIVTPAEFANEVYSKLGENHYLIELPGITYIYLYGQIYASCLS